LLNANDDTRRVFSSRIKVRVIGGSARGGDLTARRPLDIFPMKTGR
jgi:hypothetical protein